MLLYLEGWPWTWLSSWRCLGGTYDIDIIILVGVAVLSCGRQTSLLTDCWWRWRFCSTRTFYIESSIPGIRLLYHHRGQLVTCDIVPVPSAMYHSLRYGCYLTLCLCISLCLCQSVSIFCVRGDDDFVCFSMRRGLVNLRFQLRQECYTRRDLYGTSSVGMLQPVSHIVLSMYWHLSAEPSTFLCVSGEGVTGVCYYYNQVSLLLLCMYMRSLHSSSSIPLMWYLWVRAILLMMYFYSTSDTIPVMYYCCYCLSELCMTLMFYSCIAW
jgi:hypothetical protein